MVIIKGGCSCNIFNGGSHNSKTKKHNHSCRGKCNICGNFLFGGTKKGGGGAINSSAQYYNNNVVPYGTGFPLNIYPTDVQLQMANTRVPWTGGKKGARHLPSSRKSKKHKRRRTHKRRNMKGGSSMVQDLTNVFTGASSYANNTMLLARGQTPNYPSSPTMQPLQIRNPLPINQWKTY